MKWRQCQLGDALTLQRGFDLPNGSRSAGSIPVVSSAGRTGTHDVAKVSGPGVVIGRYGTLGQVHYVTEDFWPLNTTLWVKDFKGNLPLFCAYLLRTLAIAETSGAAAVPGVNRNVLHGLPINLPPLETQRRIAAILGAYDDLIEINFRRLAILEEMARGLFEEWFVRFRFPGYESVPMLEQSFGRFPSGWRCTGVAEAFTLTRGRSYRSVDLANEGGMPFVNLKCMERDGGFRSTGIKRYTGDFKQTHVVTRGDMVMAVTDMTQERRIVGRTGRIPLLDEPQAVISMDLVKVCPADGMNQTFLYCWLRNSDFGPKAAQHANGANVLHLSPKAIVDLPITIPPFNVQHAFGEVAEPLFTLAEVAAVANDRLAASRDLLLPRLISGQLSIDGAERELEEAA